jgi:hypothetical protein
MITEFKTSFRTVWVDRIIALCFFSSGAMTFALFSNTYRLNVKKLYFGFLFFYPLVASFVFLLDRLLFVLIASPLIFSLYCPTVYYSDYNYEIRRKEQIMAPIELTLIKKEFLLEKEIGTCTEIGIGAGSYRDLKILFQNDDSTNVSTVLDGKLTNLTFRNIKYN